jgi:glycosyltransferase involved in cell wall biosynthesis
MLRSMSSQRKHNNRSGQDERENSLPGSLSSVGCPSLTVCMIAHNEASNISNSLASVIGWAREVVVIDCESNDGTGRIAREMGAEVHVRSNQANLNVNKNISFDLATQRWILCLDADETIPDALKREIEQIIERDQPRNGFKIPRRNFYFGTPLMHGGNYPDRQLRLFRRGCGRFPEQHVHERLAVDGEVGDLEQYFDHFPYPSFDIWLRKFDFYTSFEASLLDERNVPITPRTIRYYMVTRPLRRWVERLFLKGGIKDGVPGVLAATFDLMNNVVSFGKYWERKQRNRD